MLCKTKGIILKHIKYNDTSWIVTIFTKTHGKKTFIVKGINSPKRGKVLRNIIQPLFLVNIEFFYKETQTLGKIKEISLDYPYSDIIVNFNKKAILMFLAEVLQKVLTEHLAEPEIFDFVYNSLKLFDLSTDNYVNFHLLFLLDLAKYLGIRPVNNFSQQNPYFLISDAQFVANYDATLGFDYPLSSSFSKLLQFGVKDLDIVKIPRKLRNRLLQAILNYYTYHIEGFGKVNSLEILTEIFND